MSSFALASAGVLLGIVYDRKEVSVRVRDDGTGIDTHILQAKDRPGHFGLRGMRERASKIRALSISGAKQVRVPNSS